MDIDLWVAVAGVLVGFIVGLTGMGGGALMTPVMVLIFDVAPLTAVSSDLVASFVMKPVGAGVHLKRGTVNPTLVKWLVIGSVPSAFAGVLLMRELGGEELQDRLKIVLGVALLLAAGSMIAKRLVDRRRDHVEADVLAIAVRPLPTLVIGIVGGLIVGMTSVGSGSLIIVMLLLLYPRLSAGGLVGTDLVQAIPLVASASLGHIFFGELELGLTSSLLLGALPGVYLGARVSSSAPDHLIRPALVLVLIVSALKLLGASNEVVLAVVAVALTGAGVVALKRRRERSAVGSAAVAGPA